MSMPALYEIRRDYLDALEALTDPANDIPPEAIADTLEGIEGQLQEKATHIAQFTRNLEAVADAIKEAETRMASRRKTIESRAQWLRDYLKHNMEASGITRIESPWFVLAVQKNPAAVEIVDEAALPAKFKQQVITEKIDKAAIKEVIGTGQLVPGARLAQGSRLVIK